MEIKLEIICLKKQPRHQIGSAGRPALKELRKSSEGVDGVRLQCAHRGKDGLPFRRLSIAEGYVEGA